jgi:hypothetical protein
MRSREELVREVESRNQARIDAHLPTLSIEAEVKKIHEAECDSAYRHWYLSHPMLPKFRGEVLAKERNIRNDPTWRPWGFFSGMHYEGEVEKKMRPLWKKERHKVITW